MKKLIAVILIAVFCLASSAGIAVAAPLVQCASHDVAHSSFWVKYGRYAVGLGLLVWLIHNNNKKSEAAAPPPQPEMLPGDRALHNVYGDNIPTR